ncbi:hypothetical protein [Neoroseomonas lacus]|uniref:Uncharacterized protein n=1 Tax=Neoroseomonas lacus TaxID=287609 RepID=A0A917K6D0_9PROT|nr:hypothetical protein [Neoroseomonas lacus]GGI99219.1 hypothetical protein GCM10011320_02410 [Neoroseomonas lacus]
MRIVGVEPGVTRVPLVIFSFDRPEYLERLGRGLLAQTQVRVDPSRVYLMQDGAVSPRTGTRYGRPVMLRRSVEVFRSLFPEGTVLPADHNLGIADNILRGQHHIFETLDEEVAYFFEDDLEPGPLYLAALEALRLRTEPFSDAVGYFAALGDQRKPLPGPEVRMTQLEHNWGFGLRRAAWRRIQAFLPSWWEEVRRTDYRAKNQARLLKVYRGWDVAFKGVGQDTATSLACASLQLARINTDVSFARYIGEQGENSTPEVFRRRAFDTMRWAEAKAFTMIGPTEEDAQRIARRDHGFYQGFRRSNLEPLLDRIEAVQVDPDRIATEEDIAALWLLMLDRRIVPPPILRRHANRTTMRDLRREIVRMRDFQRATGS